MDRPRVNDLNDIADIVAATACSFCLTRELWQLFGHRGPPRRGSMFEVFVPKGRLARERALMREFAIIALYFQILPLIGELEPDLCAALLGRIFEDISAGPVGGLPLFRAFGFKDTGSQLAYFAEHLHDYIASDRESGTLAAVFHEHTKSAVTVGVGLVGAIRLFEFGRPILNDLSSGVRELLSTARGDASIRMRETSPVKYAIVALGVPNDEPS